MIYSFDDRNEAFQQFISELTRYSIDYEIIQKDAIVVRIFGSPDGALRGRLEEIAGKRKLDLKKGAETVWQTRSDFPAGPFLIAGPCSIESEDQLERTARFLSSRGVIYLRGGAYKPRTRSSSFQGLGKTGLRIMADVARRYGMRAVTEMMDKSQLDDVAEFADVIQVGSRNMSNYSLLTALGAINKPILLKRGMAATIDEWLHAADYIRRGGNERIILCERGIRTFEPRTRFTLDILAIPIAKNLSGLPVIADPSHAAGSRDLVPPLVRAALAAGADGIMVEVHPDPRQALSDAAQALTFDDFERLVQDITRRGLMTLPMPGPESSVPK